MATLTNESEFEEVCRPKAAAELVVLKSLLEAAGMIYYVANENLSNMLPFVSNLPPFQMRIMVQRARAQEARDLIAGAVTAGDT